MEPEIQSGDVLLAIGPNDLRVGDIVVYQLPHVDIPIVHRIIKIKDNEYYLTQGDNNNIDDRQLYLQSYKDYLPERYEAIFHGLDILLSSFNSIN